jgi:hypothetical protein
MLPINKRRLVAKRLPIGKKLSRLRRWLFFAIGQIGFGGCSQIGQRRNVPAC